MNPFARWPNPHSLCGAVTGASSVLAVAVFLSLTHTATAAPAVPSTMAPETGHPVVQVQFRWATPLARARLRRGRVPGRVTTPKRPAIGPGKLSGSKTTPPPPRPTCGVPGRPPCPKTASPTTVTPPSGVCRGSACPPPPGKAGALVTPPPPPRCKGSACPSPPGVIGTPDVSPPGGGHFNPRYFESLPRITEGGRVDRGPPAFPKLVLVLLGQGQPATVEDALAQQYRLRRVNGETLTLLAARAQLYAIPDDRTVATVVAQMTTDPRVQLAQGNFIYRRQSEPRKVSATADQAQYALAKIAITAAHGLALGRGVRIAVIDSGIDTEHPDLAGVVVKTHDATGRTDPTRDGHGTAVAGIIGARGALRGVAPMAEILAVRAFANLTKQQPIASSSFILLRAIEWSVVNGAKVLNMSFVGPRDPAVLAIIAAAQKQDAVVVAAAGNGGANAPPAYPAAYPGVIAVTATDAADKRYVHANKGNYIAISAPGVDILAPADGGRHAFLSGTSFAAAHVSGIVALLLEHRRSLQPQDAMTALTDNAVDLGAAGRDEDFGFGRADAFAALQTIVASNK